MSDDRTKQELQEELRERDLPVSGSKQELLERLEEADDAQAALDEWTKSELQDALRQRDRPVSGSKQELYERLQEAEEGDEAAGDDEGEADTAEDHEDDADAAEDEAEGDDDVSDDEATEEAPAGDDDATPSDDGGSRTLKPLKVARLATRQLQMLTGRKVEGVAGLETAGDGWRVLLEVLEVARIPPSTDVLGLYEVMVDSDGDLVGYERLRRFVRAQTGDDQ